MVDWNKELDIYTLEEVLEYNDIPIDEEIINAIEAWSNVDLEVPVAAV